MERISRTEYIWIPRKCLITRVGGVEKTLTEAQATTDAAVTQAQTEWDALPDNGEPYASETGYLKGGGPRPTAVVLPSSPQ